MLRPFSLALLLAFPAALAAQDGTPTKAGDPKVAGEMKRADPANFIMLLKTNHGDVYLELFSKQAPKTVKNFVQLAEGKKEFTDPESKAKVTRPFFDGLTFHRVIKGFMIQGGCPLGTGRGDPGYKFEDEINPVSLQLHRMPIMLKGKPHPFLAPYMRNPGMTKQLKQVTTRIVVRKLGIKTREEFQARRAEVTRVMLRISLAELYAGTGYRYHLGLKSSLPKKGFLAMANSGPNTNGSQFFINLRATPWLAGKHTVFGRVIKGMDVVERIGEVPVTKPADKPEQDVKILSLRIHVAGKFVPQPPRPKPPTPKPPTPKPTPKPTDTPPQPPGR